MSTSSESLSQMSNSGTVTLFTLELFQQAARGDSYVANTSVSEVTMTIRGMEKFFDINIKSGINSEAWVGFDFR